MYIKGIGGNKLIGRDKSVSVYADPDRIQFADGTTLGDILDDAPDYSIVYVDLRLEANASVRLGDGSLLTDFKGPAGEIFDGFVMFREVTPQQIES